MPDREKVIKGLKLCRVGHCDYRCPYVSINVGCQNKLSDDAIALLEEQEAVEPKKESDGNPGKWASWWYVCGNCGEVIDQHDMYCRYCGHEVKWDAIN